MANNEKIPYFCRVVLQNFPFIEEDFDALTTYQLVSKVVEYLNKVIKSQNTLVDNVNNLSTAFQQLHDYVENYFDNLDVQEEINNKLDQMAEDGTLQEIITAYIQANVAWCFDTVAAMKANTNFINGSYAQTLGYHAKNDGGASLYKIRTITNEDVVDEGSIIALADDNLVAELIITNGTVTAEQFGAYGDGTHDDVLAIRKALKYCLSTDSTVTTWQTANELKLLDKTYLISDSIIDSTFPTSATRIAITGSGTRTGIVAGENCEIVINNVNKIGFSNFKDINFIGNDNTFLFENGSQPQRLRFIRCTFRKFHTICNIEGTVDSSEFVFNQCAVQNCGSVASPCVLFIFNNSQAVNWRFYATDIESFVGTCFKIKKGTSVNIFQGSIIPTGAGTIYDFTEADVNSIGGGNKPTFTLYGVRYEMREGAKLIYSTDYNGVICIEHICCGMGGQNISTDYAVIDITNAIPQLIFHSCWNLNNYKINMVLNRSVAAQYNNLGFFKFYNGEFEQITALANRSVFTTQNSSQAEMMAQLYYNDQNINKYNGDRVLNYAGQILNKNLTVISKSYSASSGEGVTYYMPKEGFVSNVTIESVYSTSFGATATLVAEVYNASGTKIGEGTVLIQGRQKAVIQVNAVVTTGWYVVLKHTYSNPTTLYIPHMLYAEYYS